MGTIALSLPVTGLPNTTEDPKVTNDLTIIQNVINGNLDGSNVATTAGFYRMVPTVMSSSATAVAGTLVGALPGVTVTLPAPAASIVVGVYTGVAVTGANPVTVSGTNIYGVGLSAASSFKLGTPIAAVVLQSDGAGWYIVSGQQDTGWVPLSLTTNVGTQAGAYVPSSRLQGDVVRLKGVMQNNTGGSIAGNATWATVAAGSRPAVNVNLLTSAAGFTATIGVVTTAGAITVSANPSPAGSIYLLDGLSYSMS